MDCRPTRRDFLIKTTSAVSASALLGRHAVSQSSPDSEKARPNVLWITSEDNGPQIGAYGDNYADTPNIDSFAAEGMLYLNAWSTAPVCAPARTTIISGLYPPLHGLGAHALYDAAPREYEDVSAVPARGGVLLYE